jgi:hypothetical protein
MLCPFQLIFANSVIPKLLNWHTTTHMWLTTYELFNPYCSVFLRTPIFIQYNHIPNVIIAKVDKLSCFMKFLKSLCFKQFHMFSSTTNRFLFVAIFTHHALSHYVLFFFYHWLWMDLWWCEGSCNIEQSWCSSMINFLLPQANGHACVDFGSTHPIDMLFWSLPIYLLGFFSKYECWVTNLIMPLYHSIFWVVICFFVSQGFISQWNVKNNSYDYFLNDFFYKHTNN